MTRPNGKLRLRAAGLLACGALVGACGGGRQPETPADATATLSSTAGTSMTPAQGPAVMPPSEPSPASSMPGGYEHSELEQQLIDAMAAADVVDPGIDEKGFTTAHVSGLWDSGRAWAYAYPDPEWATPGEVVDDVTVDGVAVKVVRTEGFGDVLTFWCGDVGYQVTVLGADWQVETGSVERATTFAEDLIPYLGCSV